MAFTRIKFNTTPSDSGAYSVAINPVRMELNFNDRSSVVETMDGSPVIQKAYFDSRPQILQWERLPSNITGVFSMIGTLRSYIGSKRYVHYGTADYRTSGTGWNIVRVANVNTQIEPAPASGKYAKYNIEVTLHPET